MSGVRRGVHVPLYLQRIKRPCPATAYILSRHMELHRPSASGRCTGFCTVTVLRWPFEGSTFQRIGIRFYTL